MRLLSDVLAMVNHSITLTTRQPILKRNWGILVKTIGKFAVTLPAVVKGSPSLFIGLSHSLAFRY
jgi:hypothetical protein